MKTCTVCSETLSYDSYHKSKASKDGYGYRCKTCDKKARYKYRESNKDRFYENSRKRQLKYKYGITPEEYESILRDQGGGCAICSTPTNTRGDFKFSVDHDHKTGKMRGLLCNNCNRGLGLLGDDVVSLRKALTYLTKEKETH